MSVVMTDSLSPAVLRALFLRPKGGAALRGGRYNGLGGLGALDRQNVGTLTIRLRRGETPEILGCSACTAHLEGEGLAGDIVCTEGECTFGETAIAQLDTMVKAFQIGTPLERAVAARFSGAIAQVQGAAVELRSKWIARRVPFSPVCCTYRELGRQAQDLMKQMSDAAGSPSVDPLFKQTSFIVTTFKVLAVVAVLGAVAAGGYFVYKSVRRAHPALAGARRRR